MSANIPESITYLGDNIFRACISLVSVTIPNSVTSIGNGAFSDCKRLPTIVIPNSVTSIGSEAFQNCSSLEYITIPNSVTTIGGAAFTNSALHNITIPSSITSIEESTFENCRYLSYVTIPNSVTYIGADAFRGCELSSIYTYIETPASVKVDKNAFYGLYGYTKLHVGKGLKDAYKNAETWKNFSYIYEEELPDIYEKEVNGIYNETIETDIRVIASNGSISIKGSKDGVPVYIYSTNGKLVASGITSSEDTKISVNTKGIHVVMIGKRETFKVVL